MEELFKATGAIGFAISMLLMFGVSTTFHYWMLLYIASHLITLGVVK